MKTPVSKIPISYYWDNNMQKNLPADTNQYPPVNYISISKTSLRSLRFNVCPKDLFQHKAGIESIEGCQYRKQKRIDQKNNTT